MPNIKRQLGGLGASGGGESAVITSRRIDTTAPLYGGGDLSQDRTHYINTEELLTGVAYKDRQNVFTQPNYFTKLVDTSTGPGTTLSPTQVLGNLLASGTLQCYRFIHVINYDGQTPELRAQQVTNAGAIGTAPLFSTYRARGVVNQPSGLRIGDYQGAFATAAYRESSGAYNVSVAVAGVQVDTDYGAYASIQTVASGAGTLTERMQVGERNVSKVPLYFNTISGPNRFLPSGEMPASVATPGGSDTQVQFNDGGLFGGDAALYWNKTADIFTVSGSAQIQGPAYSRTFGSGPDRFLPSGEVASSIQGFTNLQVFTVSGSNTWTKPAGATVVLVRVCGAGGGGGGGALWSGANARTGGTGGGAGSVIQRICSAADLGSTETVIVGAGGMIGVGSAVSGTGGSAGGAGGSSSFGSHVTAYGGGGGKGGTTNASAAGAGGGGGGTGSAGATGSGTGDSAGGNPGGGSATAIGGTGGNGVSAAAGGLAEWGGAGGGGTSAASTAAAGGSSLFGAAGGGSGGGTTSVPAATNGAAGGAPKSYTAGGGGTAGAAPAGSGGAGTAGDSTKGGAGGGGGGGGTGASAGGPGGAGGAAGGGGGGGGGGTLVTGGSGGAGGNGQVWVWSG